MTVDYDIEDTPRFMETQRLEKELFMKELEEELKNGLEL